MCSSVSLSFYIIMKCERVTSGLCVREWAALANHPSCQLSMGRSNLPNVFCYVLLIHLFIVDTTPTIYIYLLDIYIQERKGKITITAQHI